MVLTELPITLQNVILLNFEFYAKKLLLGFIFIFAFSYIFYFRPNQEKTPFLLVGLMRTILYVTSIGYIWFFPLTIFFLYPTVSLEKLLQLLLMFYIGSVIFFGVLLLVNVMFFGIGFVSKLGNFEIDREKNNFLMQKVFGKEIAKKLDSLTKAIWRKN